MLPWTFSIKNHLYNFNITKNRREMEQLLHAPQDQEIEFLYSLTRQDPDFLQTIDRKQLVDTPLHIAAAEGRTQLALEIQRLMPSFGRKMNPDGYSPLDLALRRGHAETVRALVKLNPELVGVQGREGITPLHYAAETDDVEMLAEFLMCSPDSIEKLTIRGESAIHVVVKNGNLAAFRVLLGWLKRIGRREVLRWRDINGNNVLHLAAATNQLQVMELVVKYVYVNEKNSRGLTALDVVMELPPEVNERALRFLQLKRAKRGSSISHPKTATLANYLSSPINMFEKTIKFELLLDVGLSSDMRNAILVVAVLIATAMYQAALSPPGGVSDQNPEIQPGSDDGNGKVLMSKDRFLLFTSLNCIALATSLGMIFLVLPIRRYNWLLHVSLLFLMLSYMEAMTVTSPPGTKAITYSITFGSYSILLVIVTVKALLMRRHRRARALARQLGFGNYIYNTLEMITQVSRSRYSSSKG